MKLVHQSLIVTVIRWFLVLAFGAAILTGHWPLAFISLVTLGLSIAPLLVVRRLHLKLPLSFIAAITVFVFATLFLGEVLDFYERFWWWDVVLHGGSAVGFGLIGVIFVLFLFEGDRYAAPPWALSMLAFCFAVTIGAVWEIFEFAMDQFFGLNMQKSGLIDTMWDLIVDVAGALVAALTGFLYFVGRTESGLASVFQEFVRLNKSLFRRNR